MITPDLTGREADDVKAAEERYVGSDARMEL